jgi:hypothetical protein
MNSFQDLKKNADDLRKNKQYKEAVEIYTKLWSTKRDKCDIWVGWGYAFSLKYLQKYEKALQICREVYKMKPDFHYNNNLYAWCIYYTEISIDEIVNESKYLKAAEGILKLTSQEEKYSPYTITVFKVLDYYNKKPIPQAKELIDWTSRLDSTFIDDQPFKATTKDGEQKELASKKEKYYMFRTKAFFENKNYNKCIETSKQALDILNIFHSNNDIWLKRFIAKSNYNLGKLDIALSQLNEILLLKKEWFIQKEIADIYFKKQEYKKSLKFAIASALNFGKFENKIHLFELLFEVLNALNNKDLAKKHIEFVCLIRKKNQWNFNDNFSQLLAKLNIDLENLPNYNKLKSNLQKEWDNLKNADRIIFYGKIKTILPHGKAGFVLSDNNESFYFSVSNFKTDKRNLSEGLKVSFYLEDSFDKKKNQKSKIAVDIALNGG